MDPEIARLMVEYEIDENVAEKAQELIEEGLDEEEAVERLQRSSKGAIL